MSSSAALADSDTLSHGTYHYCHTHSYLHTTIWAANHLANNDRPGPLLGPICICICILCLAQEFGLSITHLLTYNNLQITNYKLTNTTYAEILASTSPTSPVEDAALSSFEVRDANSGFNMLKKRASPRAQQAQLAMPVHLACAGRGGLLPKKQCKTNTVMWSIKTVWHRAILSGSDITESSTYTIMCSDLQSQ